MASVYDVFISYNRKDETAVEQFVQELQARGVSVWLDKLCLPDGQSWQREAQQALQDCSITLVCVGPNHIGDWQETEIETALNLQKQDKRRQVIPILLEGSSADVLPQFLRSHTWRDFRSGLRSHQLDELVSKLPKSLPSPASSGGKAAAPAESEEQRHLREAVGKLASFMAQGKHATFFLGSWTDEPAPQTPQKSSHVARELMRAAQLIEPDYKHLLPPVDVVGMYYAVREEGNWNGGWELEDRVVRFVTQCTNGNSPTHQALAQLLYTLYTNSRQRRVQNPDPQLIVTTNLDVQIERALLSTGIAFTRLVQHQSTTEITINEYDPVQMRQDDGVVILGQGAEEQRAQLDDAQELDCLIEEFGKRTIELQSIEGAGRNVLSGSVTGQPQRTKLILYKLLGSQDVRYSCTISSGQHFEFAQKAASNNCIPREITKLIGNSPSIFIGYGFLDPDLRLMYSLLLQEQFKMRTHVSSMRYALRLPPHPDAEDTYRRIEARIWDGIKRVVTTLGGTMLLEERGDVFLQRLTDEIKARL